MQIINAWSTAFHLDTMEVTRVSEVVASSVDTANWIGCQKLSLDNKHIDSSFGETLKGVAGAEFAPFNHHFMTFDLFVII